MLLLCEYQSHAHYTAVVLIVVAVSCVSIQAGVEGRRVALLVRDESISSDETLEDINTLLNGGAVASLFSADETSTIIADIGQRARTEAGAGTPAEVMAYFYSVVHRNLNIVVCFSPMAPRFR